MRHMTMLLVSGVLATGLLAGCNDDPTTAPGTGEGSPAPTTAAVLVGDIFFTSERNGTSNPAVDTVAVNGTVTWTWASAAVLPHSVQSLGSPSFTSSEFLTGSGKTYHVTLTAPGTYQYDCEVHGSRMTGTIVVMAASAASSEPIASRRWYTHLTEQT